MRFYGCLNCCFLSYTINRIFNFNNWVRRCKVVLLLYQQWLFMFYFSKFSVVTYTIALESYRCFTHASGVFQCSSIFIFLNMFIIFRLFDADIFDWKTDRNGDGRSTLVRGVDTISYMFEYTYYCAGAVNPAKVKSVFPSL